MSMFDSFVGLYKVSKTLRFELKPCYETLEKIERFGVLKKDVMRERYYETMKSLMDRCHKQYIENQLKNLSIDWSGLEAMLSAFNKERTEANESNLKTAQNICRSEIVEALTQKNKKKRSSSSTDGKAGSKKEKSKFEILTAATPSDLIKTRLKEIAETSDEKEALKNFEGFATYFVGYQENRKNIYTDEPESTAIAYRLVHDNFPKFMANIKAFQIIQQEMPEVLSKIEERLSEYLDGLTLEEIFTRDFYNYVLTQEGITFYNEILGGTSGQAGEVKRQGVNEVLNEFFQTHPENKSLRHQTLMVPLYKQILSDRITNSFVPQMFVSDEAVLESMRAFNEMLTSIELEDGSSEVIPATQMLLTRLLTPSTSFDKSKIYVKNASLTDFSQEISGDWNKLLSAIFAYGETIHGSAAKPANRKKIEKWCKQPYYTLAELEACLECLPQGEDAIRLENYIQKIEEKSQYFFTATRQLSKLLSNKDLAVTLRSHEGEASVEILKEFLDAVQVFYHTVKVFEVPTEYLRDLSFYTSYDLLLETLKQVVPLYNRVRNYVTKKVSEDEKFKLMFDFPTFLNGWDKNKEQDNAGLLFVREGKYYLGILNKQSKIKLEIDGKGDTSDFQKMVYKYLPGPNKMIPKVVFTKEGKKNLPTEILENYDAKKHIQGSSFDKKFLHQLIDLFKEKILANEDWKVFDFKFSPTSSYENIAQFYKEVSNQNYKLAFDAISEAQIRKYVASGELFLFQIYNKDFADGATGRPNLHTLYWKALFDAKNNTPAVAQLNGEAEVFYRPTQIKKPFKHALGEKLVNRVCTDGTTMPSLIHKEIFDYANGLKTELSATAKMYYKKAKIRDVKHEIIKDRRYTEAKFKFHVPITLNANAEGNVNINEKVQDSICNNSDVKIIGIDRGERHLLYLTLIDRNGKILEQKSFNSIVVEKEGLGKDYQQKVDYHEKLQQREQERQTSRKSWKQIGAIKELKEGYLSIVIHEIIKMMIEHNAIIVLEDLNFGFKRGRFAVERQVYQKFEKMLIDKLNYLSLKTRYCTIPGGILKGYQLTDKFESFQKLGKQSGVLFYIPAAFTSKIDPTTGFVNLLNLKYENIPLAQDTLSRFTSIRYNQQEDFFEIGLDYRNFRTSQEDFKKIWTICTVGKTRYFYHASEKRCESVDVTQALKQVCEKEGIDYRSGKNIKSAFISLTSAESLKKILWLIRLTLTLRHSNSITGDDFILSPVRNATGGFFNSALVKDEDGLPKDADANGAYHIALKGLYMLRQIDKGKQAETRQVKKPKAFKLEKIEHKAWFEFVQTKGWLK